MLCVMILLIISGLLSLRRLSAGMEVVAVHPQQIPAAGNERSFSVFASATLKRLVMGCIQKPYTSEGRARMALTPLRGLCVVRSAARER